MRRMYFGTCLLASAVLVMHAASPAQDTRSQSDKPGKTEPVKKEKLYAIGVFGGKVLEVDEDGKSFLLRVYGQTAEPTFKPGNPAAC